MATIYIAVETHHDRGIEEVFLDEEKARAFIEAPSSNYYGRRLFELTTREIDDEEILKLAERIKTCQTCTGTDMMEPFTCASCGRQCGSRR